MPPKRSSSKKMDSDDGNSDNMGKGYKQRRAKNNVAVQKSRAKSRMKAKNIVEKVNRLRSENQQLEGKVQTLSKELSVLKDLFIAHAGTVADGECNLLEQKPANTEAVQSDHVYSMVDKDS